MRVTPDIRRFVEPTRIYVHEKDGSCQIQVCCNCDWDEEHDIQLVFKDGKELPRVIEGGTFVLCRIR